MTIKHTLRSSSTRPTRFFFESIRSTYFSSSKYSPLPTSSGTHLRRKKITILIIVFGVFFFIQSILWLPIFRSSSAASWNINDQIAKLYPSTVSQSAPNRPQKFLVRDWSVWLGWNNARYVIEAALMVAKVLDRTLVLPAFTFATACEYNDQECAGLTAVFEKNVSLDLNRVSNRTWYPDPVDGKPFLLAPHLPSQRKKGWVLPIEKMMDVDHLIATWGNAIKFEDFLKLSGHKNHSIGMISGEWNKKYNGNMTYKKITNEVFINPSLTMVDRLPKPITPLISKGKTSRPTSSALIKQCESTLKKLEGNFPKAPHMSRGVGLSPKNTQETKREANWDISFDDGGEILGDLSSDDEAKLESCLASNGFRTAYAYNYLSIWMKAPYQPIKKICKLQSMVGWWDKLGKRDEQVLHLEGEMHDKKPPGVMLWTSLGGRKQFEMLTREAVRPPQLYHSIAARLELRMRAKCGGRSWVGAHMRRGDFTGLQQWSNPDITPHWNKIESNAREGIEILRNNPDLLQPSHQQFGTSLEPPRVEDPMYISTDIREADELDFMRKNNVILLNDLLDDADRRELGFSAKFMDTLAIVEQCLLMRAGFYYGDAHSSVDGWVVNGRAHVGINQAITRIEYVYGIWW